MKYVKTFENFEYNDSVNEEFFKKTSPDKTKKALDAVLNNPKAEEAVKKFYGSLPDKDKKAVSELINKTGNKNDEQLEVQLLGEAEQCTGKKPKEVEKLNQDIKKEETKTNGLNDNYKFDSDSMINEELNFRAMFDKFLTKIGFIVGSLGILGGVIVWLTTCAGAASGIFAPLWPIVTGILGSLAPVIALIVIVIGFILLIRRFVIFVSRHPATGERCNSYQQWKEHLDPRDYYDEKTDRYVFPSIPGKSFHLSELKDEISADGETRAEFWKAQFDKGEWDGKDKLGKLVPGFAKSESLNSRMKSFKKF